MKNFTVIALTLCAHIVFSYGVKIGAQKVSKADFMNALLAVLAISLWAVSLV